MLVPLPSYAPKLNLQELIWHWLQSDVTDNHFFGSFNVLIATAQRFFDPLAQQPAAVLRRIGRDFPSTLDRHLAAIA